MSALTDRSAPAGVLRWAPPLAAAAMVALTLSATVPGATEGIAAAASSTSRRVTTTSRSTTAPHPRTIAPVVVTFDQPGATPRPIRETVRPITVATQELRAEVRTITYRGLACGFTFRGTLPTGPVTIRIQGSSPSGRFDSGPLTVAWDRAGRQTEAAAATRTGWSFGAAANANRNGPGYVVSAGGIPPEGSPLPTGATCTIRTTGAAGFAPANGPVGYWAGFATN